MFGPTIYKERRKALLSRLDQGIVLLLGNEESPKNYHDNTYRFRQDSNFLYFLGLDQPHLAAILDIDAGSTTLYGNDPDINHVIWMGDLPSLAELATSTGAQSSATFSKLPKALEEAQKNGRKIHFLPPYRGENKIRLHQWLEIPLNDLGTAASVPLVQGVVDLASAKSEEEIAEMEKAVNISRLMHHAAMQQARPGMKEAELAGLIEGIALSHEGDVAYPVILSVNGQILHNHYHGNTLQEGQLVLVDAGAETAQHYAGDITRTFPVSTQFTAQQKEIYEIVLKAEQDSIASSTVGTRYLDVHLSAAQIIATGLSELGIMKGDVEEAVAAGAHALFFPHGLGHMIGLDVHDMEDLGEDYVGYTTELKRSAQFGLRSLRLGRALEAGFVITVEPGIYFIPQLIDLWRSEGKFLDFINYDALDAYRTFGGIRIEDNVWITPNGPEILGEPIAKTVAEVESLRKG
ncbi:MAG: aminopeptidase P family protein [Saprospiraceae bacterium]|nr:aminopeptidase P family protein [Saprospiraceae bacterium]